MHDMNNNNPNKYYYDTNRYMQNNSHRSHHPPSMFDNPRNDYYNGPPSYMNPNMMNNNMIPNPNSGYNHFSSSYPASGNGSFYRSFRQNWQPQVMPQQHRPMPPPPATQPQQTQQTPVSQGSQSSQSTSSQNRGFSSTSSRNNRAADESQLAKLKQNLAITQKELTRVTAEKMKLEVEEQRLQKIVEKTKSDIEKLDSRLRDPRDPRVKSRPETISVSSSSSSIENLNCGPAPTPPSLDRSCTSTFTTTTVPSMTSLSSTPVSNLITNSVPSHTVSNIPTPSDLSFTLLSTNNSRSSHTSSSGSSISNNSNSLLVQPASSIPATNQSNSSVNGSLPNTFSSNNSGSLLAFPRNMNKNVVSRGKQLNNLIEFKQLPIIFEVFGDDLLKPEIYPANQTKVKASFSITPKQMELLHRSPQHRVLLRICYFKNKNSAQSDRVSRKLAIRINSRPFSLGKQTSGSIKAPLDITTFIDTRNEIELCWPENEPGREYGLCVSINQRLSLENSLKKLQETDYQRPSSDALKMISKNFATSGDICSEEIMVPLCCPITKKRLEIPAIGLKCEHLLCFDAKSFLDINQKRLEWHCPSCKKAIGYNDIRLDCLITEILSKTPSDCLKVSFDRHGIWHPVIENKEKESTPTLIDVNKIDIITLDDSDEENMKGYDDPPEETPTNEENEAEGDDQEDEEDDDETDQETEEDEEVDDDDDSDNEDEDDDDDEEEEEGEITDKDGSNHGRCERSRRYEDDPDFVYPGNDTPSPTETPLSNGSRERKKKQLFEIFGSDADSRENSPDSSVRSPINKNKKRRRERSERRSSRKGRRHE